MVVAETGATAAQSTATHIELHSLNVDQEELILEQNAPNPFRDETIVRFSLPYRQSVQLDVFDASGAKVKMLLDDVREAGTHDVRIHTHDLKPGVYVTRLSTHSGTKTIKMIKID